MKRILALLVSLAAVAAVRAQTAADIEIDTLTARADRAAAGGDYRLAASLYDRSVKIYRSQPDSLRRLMSYDSGGDMIPDFYYNQACYLSMSGRRRAAVEAFERYVDRSVGREEPDYAWACKDSDLDPVRSDRRFAAALERLGEWGDYQRILRRCAGYAAGGTDSLPQFRYAAPNDRNLVRVREHFNLDSVAGSGDEISKILNLLRWVHDAVPHDGSSYNPRQRNALAMIELCRREKRGVNCRMMAQILNECYLAMGFKSRFVTCLPRNYVCDCHVITTVYSATLDKWVWVDPTFAAYLTDENGTLLSIAEVRERIRDGREVRLNEDANWNHRVPQTKEHYIDHYMAKNLYYLVCTDLSMFDNETACEGRPAMHYVLLQPEGATPPANQYHFATADDAWFWQSPYATQDF